ncbi:MAG: TRAP transporter small permease, partial [Propionivibrio sp.]
QQIASRIEMAVAGLLLVAICVLVFSAALSRYLATPVNWSVDAAQGLFVWVVFLGASQAMRRNKHLGVDFMVERLPYRVRKSIHLLLNIIILVFLAAIVAYGIQVSVINYNRDFPSFPVSYSYVTIAVSVGGTLMFITKLLETWALFRIGKGRRK